MTLVKSLEQTAFTEDVGQIMKMLTLDIFGQSALWQNFGCCETLQSSRVAEAFAFMTHDMMRRLLNDILNLVSHMCSVPTATNQKNSGEQAYLRSYTAGLVQKRRQQLLQTIDEGHPRLTH